MDLCQLVRTTTKYVCNNLKCLKICEEKVREECEYIAKQVYKNLKLDFPMFPLTTKLGKKAESKIRVINGLDFENWKGVDYLPQVPKLKKKVKEDEKSEEKKAMFALLMSCNNFCYWPMKDFEAGNLAKNLIWCIENRKEFLVENLPKMNEKILVKYVFNEGTPTEDWLLDERARLFREVGLVLLKEFKGKASNLLLKSGKSAVKLVSLVTQHFPGFLDSSIYKGRQVFLLKRAQLFVAVVFRTFDGKSLGNFADMEKLTMFPDYRIPQLFFESGVIELSQGLKKKIESEVLISPNSVEEIELRAVTVQIVETIKANLLEKFSINCCSHEIDWYLWNKGEKIRDKISKHHRTLTTCY